MTDSLGISGLASIGGKIDLYEPVHVSAPDIAGKNVANQVSAIASAAIFLRYMAKAEKAANNIKPAINRVLENGHRTLYIIGDQKTQQTISIEQMEMLIRQSLQKNAKNNFSHRTV